MIIRLEIRAKGYMALGVGLQVSDFRFRDLRLRLEDQSNPPLLLRLPNDPEVRHALELGDDVTSLGGQQAAHDKRAAGDHRGGERRRFADEERAGEVRAHNIGPPSLGYQQVELWRGQPRSSFARQRHERRRRQPGPEVRFLEDDRIHTWIHGKVHVRRPHRVGIVVDTHGPFRTEQPRRNRQHA